MGDLFTFDGRLNRAKYFVRVLAIYAVTIAASAMVGFIIGLVLYGRQSATTVGGLAGGLIGLVAMVIVAIQAVKRLHDLDRPGTHYWLLLVPFYNIYLGLLLLFQKGTDGPNRFGSDPLGGRSRTMVAGA